MEFKKKHQIDKINRNILKDNRIQMGAMVFAMAAAIKKELRTPKKGVYECIRPVAQL